ncbi:MAG: 50S ribosomal protein L32 [Deltaproteobacteria bacterium]|nr:50S ribosomal protein L32 [Deltaproteobacteria bacterium]
MPVPKYRTSASKRDMRRSHHALKSPGLSLCSNCQEVRQPHVACAACGHYGGRQVIMPRKMSEMSLDGLDTQDLPSDDN